MGPIYSMQNLHLLTHMFIHEYAVNLDPSKPMTFAEQPMKEARPMYSLPSSCLCLHNARLVLGCSCALLV